MGLMGSSDSDVMHSATAAKRDCTGYVNPIRAADAALPWKRLNGSIETGSV